MFKMFQTSKTQRNVSSNDLKSTLFNVCVQKRRYYELCVFKFIFEKKTISSSRQVVMPVLMRGSTTPK
jgi:hypothetical protein